MSKPLRNRPKEVADVAKMFPAGTRLLCKKNGKTYQIGTQHGRSDFWMLCEQDSQRGLVGAMTIMREFEKVSE